MAVALLHHETPVNEREEAALRYAEMGLKVLPLQPKGKKPYKLYGVKHATEDPKKIIVSSKCQELARFHVRNSDIDSNNHVNNTRYAQWILDSLPIDLLKKGVELKGYEVNFLLAFILVSQNFLFVFGRMLCLGQPCQKHPSTNTATLAAGNTMSGFPGKAFFKR